jgi:hypothetical protein
VEWGENGPGANRIHSDSVPCFLSGKRLRERDDTRLGNVVLSHAGARIERVGGRNVDDRGALPPAHFGQRFAREISVSEQVDSQDFVPSRAACLSKRLVGPNSCIIHQDVETSERCFGYIDGARCGLFQCEVESDANDLRMRNMRVDMCNRRLNCIRFLVDDENGSPLFAKQLRGGRTDAAGSAGYDRGLSR